MAMGMAGGTVGTKSRMAAVVLLAVALVTVSGRMARAEEPVAVNPAQPVRLDAKDWSISLTPRAWYVAPRGKIELPSAGAGQRIELSTLQVDKPRIAPLGQVDAQAGNWLFTLGGVHTKESAGSVAGAAFQLGNTVVAGGQAFESRFEYTGLQAGVGYKVFAYNLSDDREEDAGETRLRLHAIGGLRMHDIKFSIERPGVAGTRSEDSRTLVEVMAAGRGQLVISNDFAIDVDLSLGGLDRSVSWDIAAAFTYRPCDWFGAQVGYRYLGVTARGGSAPQRFKWDGGLAGLFAGVNFRF